MAFMFNQIKRKRELVDPDVHASKIQCMLKNLRVKQLCVINSNRMACRSLLAGSAASLVSS